MAQLPATNLRRVPHYEQGLPFSLGQPAQASAAITAAAAGLRAAVGERNPARALRLLRAIAAAGLGEALHVMGLAYFRGDGVARDLATARRLQTAAAERGVVDAQFELSLLLAGGLGGRADARGARRWEERAADAGHPRACLNRAARLAAARRPDFAEVARWYARAADAGSAEAA